MPTKLKRPWTNSSRAVSPPVIKRRATASRVKLTTGSNKLSIRFLIFSWNVNGINAFLQKPLSLNPQALFPLRTFLKRHQWPQFLCLQEVKISVNDEATQHRLEQSANIGCSHNEPTYRVQFSLPRDKYNATGFGGRVHGVATLIRDDFASHVKLTTKPDWDLEGRVLIHELIDDIVVINGYWVNGTNHPYRNPTTGVEEGTRHDHKLRFHQHMLEEIRFWQHRQKHIVLVGDMNVAREQIDGHPNLRTSPLQHVKNRSDFNSKFFTSDNGLQGIDVFRQIHGETRKYTYYPRGVGWGQSCDRIDLIIVNNTLFASGAVKSTNICDNPEDRGHSDHVPIWVELDLAVLLLLSKPEAVASNENVMQHDS